MSLRVGAWLAAAVMVVTACGSTVPPEVWDELAAAGNPNAAGQPTDGLAPADPANPGNDPGTDVPDPSATAGPNPGPGVANPGPQPTAGPGSNNGGTGGSGGSGGPSGPT
ncbi:MAG: hypothetical protein R3249_12110, partial [Nitriliruptorales bacterium]|nr:hypothetical protein [Nitriliruptorales bacterium]